MTKKFQSRPVALLLAGMVAVSASWAQTAPAVIGNSSIPTQLTLNVPSGAPSDVCAAVSSAVPQIGRQLTLRFLDEFNTFDINKGPWRPHYDGGYDAVTQTYLGYDWMTKRTLQSNGELQMYVDPGYKGNTTKALGLSPYKLSAGILSLVANKTPANMLTALYGYQYTSGMLSSRASFVQQYGYFEARVKVPAGQGLWPAFWLLPADKSWPPEIDVMEVMGSNPTNITGAAHWNNAAGAHVSSTCKKYVADAAAMFHTYGMLWTPERITYYIDRVAVGDMKADAGLNKPMYMLLNLAVGGYWPGAPDGTTKFPAEFQINWVAAYSL